MLIYRENATSVETLRELARLNDAAARVGARCNSEEAMTLLIRIGELESAIADAPGGEGVLALPRSSARDATVEAARVWISAWRDRTGETEALCAALMRLTACTLPRSVTLRVSEGFAYYALFPQTYLRAAERYAAEERPPSVVVLGIRSIGTTLSAVVAAALEGQGCRTTSWTVRPGGHPFDRRLSVHPDLARVLRTRAAEGASFAIVDEGPGLSGSSFASVADALQALGVESSRIVLFPGWEADADRLRSPRARRVWRTHKRCCVTACQAGIAPERLFTSVRAPQDWSGGRWRESLYDDRAQWPPVQPQNERWKVRLEPERRVIRFAGLGEYGRRTELRARTLFDAGLAERPGDLRSGFLNLPFVAGAPLVSGTVSTSEASAIGRYIGCVSTLFRVEGETDATTLAPMIETNVAELLQQSAPVPDFVPGPVVRVDGRMLAHEWLRTEHGLRKIDALDHHDDHFFPGLTDPAWDLAGAAIELALNERCEQPLLTEYARVSGDTHIRTRLPFYRVAYLAFRAGYCAMQADALDGADGEGFARAREQYVKVLRQSLKDISLMRHL